MSSGASWNKKMIRLGRKSDLVACSSCPSKADTGTRWRHFLCRIQGSYLFWVCQIQRSQYNLKCPVVFPILLGRWSSPLHGPLSCGFGCGASWPGIGLGVGFQVEWAFGWPSPSRAHNGGVVWDLIHWTLIMTKSHCKAWLSIITKLGHHCSSTP